MSAQPRTTYDRPPRCACQPGCGARSVGVVAAGARAANGCRAHGERAAARLGGRFSPVPRWERYERGEVI